ncbi:hypothetical protein [Pararhodobacter sp.]|uniref:hypothetical protein n=1 Tax=Pararhodobacter sp. TaxID=2127056 RepID=UPI002FDD87A0
MVKKLDADEMSDRDDDLPVLADDDTPDDAPVATKASVLDDMEDHEEHLKGLLSDEELAALEDDGDDDGDEGEGDPEEGDDDGAEPQGAAPEADEPARPEAQAAPPPAAIELTPEQIAEIETAHEAAEAKALEDWRDGELTDAELQAQLKAIRAETAQKHRDAMDAIAEEREATEWQKVVDTFHADARAYIADHPGLEKPEALADFDRHVRLVTGNARFEGRSNVEKLAAAHRLYIAEAKELGLKAPPMKAAKKPAEAEPEPEAAKPAARKPKPEVVPTLGRVPAAATNSASDGKWGQLQTIMDRGTPEEVERAMAGLSDEEREAFASADV